MKHCMVKDCTYPIKARSLCSMHYWYWRVGKLDIKVPEPMTHAQAGAIGGRKGTTGGFWADRELARRAGAIGGRISRPRKKTTA